MRRLWIVCLLLVVGCTKDTKPEIKYPERLPITEQAKELSALPDYQEPSSEGQAVAVAEGEPAPIDGILLDETKAGLVAELRISYDELYRMSDAQIRYLLAVIEIQEKELYRGDQIIDWKEAQLQEIRDSWWERNKLGVGLTLGIVGGIVVSLATGKVWSRIEANP